MAIVQSTKKRLFWINIWLHRLISHQTDSTVCTHKGFMIRVKVLNINNKARHWVEYTIEKLKYKITLWRWRRRRRRLMKERIELKTNNDIQTTTTTTKTSKMQQQQQEQPEKKMVWALKKPTSNMIWHQEAEHSRYKTESNRNGKSKAANIWKRVKRIERSCEHEELGIAERGGKDR